MTPSRDICSSTITFLMIEFLQHLDNYLVASFKVGKRRLKYYGYHYAQITSILEYGIASRS
jgi:hypothetical protein